MIPAGYLQNIESIYELNELFFSTTDSRGVIESFNEVFIRVSEFSASELYRKPHNIIRHPHMPRVVFRLLWGEISEGRSLCAYVKNKTKSGKYYWVFAMAFPIETGYLSIRLRPSSAVREKVEKLYETMLAAEQNHNDSEEGMAQAGSLLFSALKDLGFNDYREFMQFLLVEELTTRDQILSSSKNTFYAPPTNSKSGLEKLYHYAENCFQHASQIFSSIVSFKESVTHFKEVAKKIQVASAETDLFTTNLTISANRFAEKGEVLSVVSKGFSGMASEIKTGLDQLFASVNSLEVDHKELSFLAGISKFQIEMLFFFVRELEQRGWSLELESAEKEQVEFHKNSALIQKLIEQNILKIENRIVEFRKTFGSLSRSIFDLNSVITGMDMVKISGMIEISRLNDPSHSLKNHVESMAKLIETFKRSLGSLYDESQKTILRFEKVYAGAGEIRKGLKSFTTET